LKQQLEDLAISAFDEPDMLYFSLNNVKLAGTKTAAFSLPAGYSCPGAKDCLAWWDRDKKKLIDGKHQKFRCFAASLEAAFPSVAKSVDNNLRKLKTAKTVESMADLIHRSLPSAFYENIRVHADGDFFSADYFMAWMAVAARYPERTFYAYTKSLQIWIKHKAIVPPNFVLTASKGGKWDMQIAINNLRYAEVVYHPEEAEKLGLKIDHDDSLARDANAGNFGLLIHGVQPAGSAPSAALKRMKSENINYSYSHKKSLRRKRKGGPL
jgi:hypothetical protein